MWADNFNGVAHHLQDRAAFVLVSADSPAAQQEFARGRGWRFPIYSAAGSTFTAEMGFQSPAGGFMSGYQPAFRSSARATTAASRAWPMTTSARRPLLRRLAPVQSAPRRLGWLGPATRLPGARLDHWERKGGAGTATPPLLFTRSIYTPVLWPGAGRPGKESGTSGA